MTGIGEIGDAAMSEMIEHHTTFEVPKYVGVLLGHVQEKIGRNYWRTHQQTWDGISDPAIEGLMWRPIQTTDGALGVRLSFDGVDLRWVGSTRQEMSANVSWSTQQWNAWFDRLMVWIGH
jgi:hypothetical protein